MAVLQEQSGIRLAAKQVPLSFRECKSFYHGISSGSGYRKTRTQKKEVRCHVPGVVVKLNLCIGWVEEYYLLALAFC